METMMQAQVNEEQTYTPLPLRAHTILGVCEAIGEDFGFNPAWLRIPLARGEDAGNCSGQRLAISDQRLPSSDWRSAKRALSQHYC